MQMLRTLRYYIVFLSLSLSSLSLSLLSLSLLVLSLLVLVLFAMKIYFVLSTKFGMSTNL